MKQLNVLERRENVKINYKINLKQKKTFFKEKKCNILRLKELYCLTIFDLKHETTKRFFEIWPKNQQR